MADLSFLSSLTFCTLTCFFFLLWVPRNSHEPGKGHTFATNLAAFKTSFKFFSCIKNFLLHLRIEYLAYYIFINMDFNKDSNLIIFAITQLILNQALHFHITAFVSYFWRVHCLGSCSIHSSHLWHMSCMPSMVDTHSHTCCLGSMLLIVTCFWVYFFLLPISLLLFDLLCTLLQCSLLNSSLVLVALLSVM